MSYICPYLRRDLCLSFCLGSKATSCSVERELYLTCLTRMSLEVPYIFEHWYYLQASSNEHSLGHVDGRLATNRSKSPTTVSIHSIHYALMFSLPPPCQQTLSFHKLAVRDLLACHHFQAGASLLDLHHTRASIAIVGLRASIRYYEIHQAYF